jgi:alpha-N-acetylglucosaminidase
MKRFVMYKLFSIGILFIIVGCASLPKHEIKAAKDVLIRTIGIKKADLFEFKIDKTLGTNDSYSVTCRDGKILVTGNSSVALCRGSYDYLGNACNSIVSWSGNRINIPDTLPNYSNCVTSPYQYRYYMNVVTHGYTTVYWDWNRWEKEIDWMALHGLNMPLLGGAHEAILYRVFKKLGLTDEEIDTYFTGPAFLPWNRMGNITGWDRPKYEINSKDYFTNQLKLTHKILTRLKELGMHPIVPAFAGFVPEGLKRLYPNQNIRDIAFGAGFSKQYSGHILAPTSDLFEKIGKLYIEEWEKEFGKNKFYLADSFNEMSVPLSADSTQATKELASYGKSVYLGIHNADPEAIWVMQGWTFPFQKDSEGKLFWTPQRLSALISGVPDDKLLILDMANEYNRLWWKIAPSWEMYTGFFGKKWIYSFIPNMGGKIPLNGRLDLYASMSIEALKYKNKKNLVGFGFAPEGIENNEIIYELLSDMGWSDKVIDLNQWIPKYCEQRYGAFPNSMKDAFHYLLKSCYGSFTDHPRFRYQLRPNIDYKSLPFDFKSDVNSSDDFRKGVEAFLKCKDEFTNNSLYSYDAIELVSQFLELKADEFLMRFREESKCKDYQLLDEGLELLTNTDRLLASHPNYKLQNWIDYARKFGRSRQEKDYYEMDAKRLITTWGKGVSVLDDYSARTWSGLIADYYIPRWKLFYEAKKENSVFDLAAWEENWIKTPWTASTKPFNNPIEEAYSLFQKYNTKIIK